MEYVESIENVEKKYRCRILLVPQQSDLLKATKGVVWWGLGWRRDIADCIQLNIPSAD